MVALHPSLAVHGPHLLRQNLEPYSSKDAGSAPPQPQNDVERAGEPGDSYSDVILRLVELEAG